MWLLLFAVGFVWMLVLLPSCCWSPWRRRLGDGVGFESTASPLGALGVLAGLPVFMVIAVVPLTSWGPLHGVQLQRLDLAYRRCCTTTARPRFSRWRQRPEEGSLTCT